MLKSFNSQSKIIKRNTKSNFDEIIKKIEDNKLFNQIIKKENIINPISNIKNSKTLSA
jgi:hypothetical protein